jgi:hypothetical protein
MTAPSFAATMDAAILYVALTTRGNTHPDRNDDTHRYRRRFRREPVTRVAFGGIDPGPRGLRLIARRRARIK